MIYRYTTAIATFLVLAGCSPVPKGAEVRVDFDDVGAEYYIVRGMDYDDRYVGQPPARYWMSTGTYTVWIGACNGVGTTWHEQKCRWSRPRRLVVKDRVSWWSGINEPELPQEPRWK